MSISSYNRISIYGLLTADPDLFSEMVWPEGISAEDAEDILNNILLECYELEVLYPDPVIMKKAIGIWARQWKPNFERILLALSEEYNPLHNFDRHEVYSDLGTNSVGRSNQQSSTESGNAVSTTSEGYISDETGKVNGYNLTEGIADHDKSHKENTGAATGTSTNNGTSSISGSSSEAATNSLNHEGHLFGNIGVTESTTMLQHEIDTRAKYNFMEIITNSFRQKFCVGVY